MKNAKIISECDRFIEKLGAIPEDQWTTGVFINRQGQCCALGHCGLRLEAAKLINRPGDPAALIDLFLAATPGVGVDAVNDGHVTRIPARYESTLAKEAGPKNRVLKMLSMLRADAVRAQAESSEK